MFKNCIKEEYNYLIINKALFLNYKRENDLLKQAILFK